ncbi:MAG TPA: sugar ABC transporter substrate-binding protein [Patescibacteria group bacterium]|nr:sugar ABC transporter substrate-binding protein [Patescibacteria group bacterium]
MGIWVMRAGWRRLIVVSIATALAAAACAPAGPAATPPVSPPAGAVGAAAEYAAPVPLAEGSQAVCSGLAFEAGTRPRIAYMPPATEFPYYMAIGEGIKAQAAMLGVDTFLLAPQSGADILGQMGMIADVITQGVDAIILSTHDEGAAAPLVRRAVDQGIAIIIVNSDIAKFPAPVHGVVGYQQRAGTRKLGEYAISALAGRKVEVGVIEGQPGYHSTERVGGFLDAIEGDPNFTVVASVDGRWNVDGGNKAATDMLQANPDIDVVFAANDYMILGAAKAAKALGMEGLVLYGNDGDTNAGLEPIAAGDVTATVDTSPFVMGEQALQVTIDCLNGIFGGGYVETPTTIVDATNVLAILCRPEKLFPPPNKLYTCP